MTDSTSQTPQVLRPRNGRLLSRPVESSAQVGKSKKEGAQISLQETTMDICLWQNSELQLSIMTLLSLLMGGLAKCVQRAYSVVDASQQALANTAARFLHSLNFANGCCQPSLAHLLSEIIICTTKSQC